LFVGNSSREVNRVLEAFFLDHFPQFSQSRPSADARKVNVATPHIPDVQRNVQKDIQAFLAAHGSHITNEVAFVVFQFGFRRDRLERIAIGTVADYEDVRRIEAASGYRKFAVTAIGCHHNIAEAIREFFKPHQDFVERPLIPEFRDVQFRIRVVMIEDVFDAQEFKRQRDQENVVGRIAALNDMESAPQKDPPGVQEFPEQGATVLAKVAEGAIAFLEYRMPVNVNSLDEFVPSVISAAGA